MNEDGQTHFLHRPNKAFARARILDIIDERTDIRVNREEYYYISLGGFRCIDLVNMYHRFHLQNLVSIEKYPAVHKRAIYNKPYYFIRLEEGTIEDFVVEYLRELQEYSKILFLDYNPGLSEQILHEIEVVCHSDMFRRPALWFLAFNAKLDTQSNFYRDYVPNEVVTQDEYYGWVAEFIPERIRGQLLEAHPTIDIREMGKYRYFDTSHIALFAFQVGIEGELEGDFEVGAITEIAVPDLTEIETHLIRTSPNLHPDNFYEDYGIPKQFVERFREYD